MSDDDENKDVSVVLEEREEQEGFKNETNHLPKHIVNKVSKKYKSEKSVKFLFREATKARNEHMGVNSTKKNNSKGKGVVNLEYEKEREENEEEDFSTPGDSKDSAQTMMKEEDSLANTNNTSPATSSSSSSSFPSSSFLHHLRVSK